MRVIHLSHSDINGGAARAAYRIHLSLLKKDVNSHMWVNKASSGHFTIKQPTSKIDKVINELRPRLINYSLVKKKKKKVLLFKQNKGCAKTKKHKGFKNNNKPKKRS